MHMQFSYYNNSYFTKHVTYSLPYVLCAHNTLFFKSKLIVFLLVKGQHKDFIYVTTRGLQFFPWLLPNLMVMFPAVSLASLCDLKPEEESCETSSRTYVQCDLTVTVGTQRLPDSWPYLYICEESIQCHFAPDHRTESVFPSFSGLFIRWARSCPPCPSPLLRGQWTGGGSRS